jgi:hypothetical protein
VKLCCCEFRYSVLGFVALISGIENLYIVLVVTFEAIVTKRIRGNVGKIYIYVTGRTRKKDL